MVRQKVPKLYFQSQSSMSKINGFFSKKKIRLRPNVLGKRLGGRSLSRLMKNFGLGPLTD